LVVVVVLAKTTTYKLASMVFEGDDGGAYDFSWKKCTQFGATESGVFWGLAMRTANLLVSQSVSQSVSIPVMQN
jgi:hypothetical protein